MKAAVLHEYDPTFGRRDFLSYESVPDPEIEKPTDVIVRIGGAGVCRTDLHIIEGLWREKINVQLPYILGHENAGWVEEVGQDVRSVKVGDAVVCHPLVTAGHSLEARRGNDMHDGESVFPGVDSNGGYAEHLVTGERALVKLTHDLTPKEVAPYADAGLTAYRASKKASKHLVPGDFVVVIGAGGLGHIGIQVLKSLCAAEVIVVDRSEPALSLAKECGADHVVIAHGDEVDAVKALTAGSGAHAVIDFVAEGDTISKGLAMTRNAGSYYLVGYGGKIEIPTMDLVISEKSIISNLVGNYAELCELMMLARRKMIKLATKEYRLRDVNVALHDLHAGRIKGRAVLVP